MILSVTGSGGWTKHVLNRRLERSWVNAGSGDRYMAGQGGDDISFDGGRLIDDSLIEWEATTRLVVGSGMSADLANNSGVIGVPDAGIPFGGHHFQGRDPNG